MKIKLDFLLRKKQIALFDFCLLNEIDSYKELQSYCKLKNMICVDETFYKKSIPSTILKESNKAEPKEQSSEKSNIKPKAHIKRRGTSKASKVPKKRSSSTKSTS